MLIAAGTSGSAGGDLIAAISALSDNYIANLETPVAGTFTANISNGKLDITVDSAIFVRIVANTVITKGTLEFGIDADYIEGDDVSITLTGDTADLNALFIGDTLQAYSKGEYVETGGTYYVTYYYNRPVSDYLVYKEFTDYGNLQDDLGFDVQGNTLVNISNLAMNYYGVPKIAVVQLNTGSVSEQQLS